MQGFTIGSLAMLALEGLRFRSRRRLRRSRSRSRRRLRRSRSRNRMRLRRSRSKSRRRHYIKPSQG